MCKPIILSLCTALLLGTVPARADVPATVPAASAPAATPPAATTAPATKPASSDTAGEVKKYLLTRPNGMPSRLERLVVAGVAVTAAAAALAFGVGMGVWAYVDYQCLRDVAACNKQRASDQQIDGTNFLRYRGDGERKALFADMGYLASGTAVLVALLSTASAFWPAGWWPFAVDDQPIETAPRQVVTQIAPTAAPSPAAAPAATPPAAPEPAPPASTTNPVTAPPAADPAPAAPSSLPPADTTPTQGAAQ